MDPLSLDDLLAFHLIASEGGISAAARRSRASKATLSRALARLEDAAGTPLFDRTTQGFRLTQTGASLASVAEGTAALAREAEAVLRAATDMPQGRLRIAAGAMVAQQVLGPVLAELHRRFPQVRAEVIVTGTAPNPLAEDIDVMLRIGQPSEDYLVVRRIMRSPLQLYIPAARLGEIDPENPVSVESLGRVVIRAPGLPEDWTLRDEAGGVVRLTSEPLASVGDPAVVLGILQGGSGVGLLPAVLGDLMVRAGLCVRALPRHAGPMIEGYACLPPRRASIPAVRVFIDLLAEFAWKAMSGHQRDS
ncbi:LysR family transcriptional regulator [Salipiger mangrovisoli]|uniref:LysR family transcriptional regulator n=1 Tax=Salipiger mangrovisoli TaxID=2865933 RepID=A0ABR9XAB5_9RHOB|nr:LysR family transcriptional regulator [Salipiger mangrovisoli]MBE9640528.1 LysR family transcriptional regulator [Salipiger mangrovisoli]